MSSFSAVGLLLSPLYGVSVVPSSQWPYHLRRMITESSAFDRMPVVESNASLRTSRCTPLAGAMVNVCAPASCWISAAHTPAAFTTTRAETSNVAAALHVVGRHAGGPAVGGGAHAGHLGVA